MDYKAKAEEIADSAFDEPHYNRTVEKLEKALRESAAQAIQETKMVVARHAALCGPDFAKLECGVLEDLDSRAAALRQEGKGEGK